MTATDDFVLDRAPPRPAVDVCAELGRAHCPTADGGAGEPQESA